MAVPSSGKMSLARAKYDNLAELPDELAFRKGEVLAVIEQNLEGLSGWWLCSCRGRQGIAPANRLTLLAGQYNESALRFHMDPAAAGADYDVPRPNSSRDSRSSPVPAVTSQTVTAADVYDVPNTQPEPLAPTYDTVSAPVRVVPGWTPQISPDDRQQQVAADDRLHQVAAAGASQRLPLDGALQQVSPNRMRQAVGTNDSAIDMLSRSSRSSILSSSSVATSNDHSSNIYDSLSGPPVAVVLAPPTPDAQPRVFAGRSAVISVNSSDYRDSGVYDNARNDEETTPLDIVDGLEYDVPVASTRVINEARPEVTPDNRNTDSSGSSSKLSRSCSEHNEYDYCDLEDMEEVEEAQLPVIANSRAPLSNDHAQDVKYLRYHFVRVESLFKQIRDQCGQITAHGYRSQVALMSLCKSLLVAGHQIMYISDTLTKVLRRDALISSIKYSTYTLSNSLKSLAMMVREVLMSSVLHSPKLDENVRSFEKSVQSFHALLRVNIAT